MKIFKKIVSIIAALVLIFTSYVIVSVHYWSIRDEGRLPVKTAVILHAVNNNLITTDMKPPKFLTQPRPATFAREDIVITIAEEEEIPVRIYYPKSDGPHPVILYYHGGAFMEGYGNLETHDNVIRALAVRTDSVVIAVSYRLAPVHAFPTAVDDSYHALLWAEANVEKYNGNPNRMAVVGDSAGGNLATAVALMSRDLGGPELVGQALLYPLTTFQDMPLQSRILYDSGYYLLSRNVMYRARELYTPMEEMWLSPYTSPLNAENLEGLPPTLIITAEFDPLRDEGELYGVRLAEAGVPVQHLHYEGVMHGFISFYEIMQSGQHGLGKTVTFLKDVFREEKGFQSDLQQTVVSRPEGFERVRDVLEAYAIAVFLIYQETTR
ncbi:alpha/beta hydrolase [Anaerobacillus alkaliphilus]|uniref:Alpha/beta hydrolase n=1 Tax=Anaerobacillus alkaliphilus TaxID=1548597 RepID=A0A4Q0VY87_9BACI|nr:alpha/beta hydrolase [Anaerobacillus alkaliphilus]RXJ04078.1 alpha/beta hydrolase [Anaerobacillus alkaliphilus]